MEEDLKKTYGFNNFRERGSNEKKTKLKEISSEHGAEIVSIISKKDKKEHDINSDYNTNREDRCKFICKCKKEGDDNIRNIIETNRMLCRICRNKIKQQERKKTNQTIYGREDHMQIASIKNKVKETINTNKKMNINRTYDKNVKEFESKLKKEYSAFKIQRIYKKVKSKLYIGRIVLLTRAFYMYLKNPIEKLSYKNAITFLKLFRFVSKDQYTEFVRHYDKIPLYRSPHSRTYPGFSINTYLSNKDFKIFKKYKHINKTYKETSEFAQNVVYPWAVKNGYDHLSYENIWIEYCKANKNSGNDNKGINGYPMCPRKHYGRDAKQEEWKKNGSWEGFFGNIEKKYRVGNKNKKILTKEWKQSTRMETIKKTNIKYDINDLLYPGIYLYIFPDGKKYVGQTNGTVLNRLTGHLRDAYNKRDDGCIILDNKIRHLIKSVNNEYPKDLKKWEETFITKVQIVVLEIIEKKDLTNDEYINILNDRERYFIKEHKCYIFSKDYDGKMGLNCKPGEGGKEMRKRDENSCYDHNGDILQNGIESIKIRDIIVGYKSRKRGKYEHSISLGRSNDLSLDEKLKIAFKFKNLKITSVESEKKIIQDFKKKYNLKNITERNRKSNEKQDHKGGILPTGVFYNPKEKYYRFYICRQGVSKEYKIFQEDCDSLDEARKEAIFLKNKILRYPLDSNNLYNKTRSELFKYIKDRKYPIVFNNRRSWYTLLKYILKYENPKTKQEVIDEYERLKN